MLLDRTLLAASDAMEEGKRIMIELALKISDGWKKIGYEYFGFVFISVRSISILGMFVAWILCQTKK